MRKLLVVALVVSAVFVACETKSPTGPAGVTPTTSTTSTTTTSVAPATTTTSSSTTSTIVLGSLARKYVAFQPPPNVPSEMTLFFELITPQAAQLGQGLLSGLTQVAGVTENEYKVTGVYIMVNGTTGTVNGELGGSLNPLETGGTLDVTLTAKTPTGCTAERQFSGPATPSALNLVGGAPGTATCSPSPLSMASFSMLRSDQGAPLPTPPTTTSTTSTTTTSVVCTYSLSSTSFSVPSTASSQTVTVSANTACAWSAQSFASWITVRPPYGGAGTGTVTFDIQANTSTSARVGTLLIAGSQVTVSQSGIPQPDLVPEAPAESSCLATFPPAGGSTYSWSVTVRNQGAALAGASTTTVVYTSWNTQSSPAPTSPTRLATSSLPAGGFQTLSIPAPEDCFVPIGPSYFQRCTMAVTVDEPPAVAESNESNNGPVTVSCTRNIG